MTAPTWNTVTSSWLRAVAYVRPAADAGVPAGHGLVLMWTQDNRVYCWLAPSWVYGLICAHRSTGRAITVLLKRYATQRAIRVRELEVA